MDWGLGAIYLGLGMAVGGLVCVLLERLGWIARRSSLAGVFIILGRLTVLVGIAVAFGGALFLDSKSKDPSLWWASVVGLVIALIAAVGMLLYAARANPVPATPATPATAPEPAPAKSSREARREAKAERDAERQAEKAAAHQPAPIPARPLPTAPGTPSETSPRPSPLPAPTQEDLEALASITETPAEAPAPPAGTASGTAKPKPGASDERVFIIRPSDAEK